MAANVTVSGTIGQIFAPETFQSNKNGNNYTFQGIVINTQGYQRVDPVYVKFNIDRISTANFKVGQPISVDCNVTSSEWTTKTGIKMWRTDLMVWKVNQQPQQQPAAQPQQQPQQQVAQQPTQQVQQVQQPTQQAQQPTPQQKDDDLPF